MSAMTATIRSTLALPVRLADGFETQGLVVAFDGLADGREHVAVVLGEPGDVPLVRVHSECLTGDVLGSQRCDCGPQLHEAVRRISRCGGYVLYLRKEGRGIGLYNKLDAYTLQDAGLDTYEANLALGFAPDQRDYGVAAQMLLALGVDTIALLTNNPDKVAQLERAGVRVESRVPTGVHRSPANHRYLDAKAWNGHLLDGEGA
jgi:GTP cyclohydrolase II